VRHGKGVVFVSRRGVWEVHKKGVKGKEQSRTMLIKNLMEEGGRKVDRKKGIKNE